MFYVYEHWRPDTNLPFYVGKGKGKRAYIVIQRGRSYQEIVDLLKQRDLHVDVRIVASELAEREAFMFEMERIAYWRTQGIELVNLTNGGDGTWGLKYTEERRKKLSRALRGKKFTEEHSRNLGLARRGKPLSQEHKQKLSVISKGRKFTEEHKLKISLSLRGKPKSESERIRLRETGDRGRMVKRSPEARARMSVAQKKVKLSVEALARIRAAVSRAQKGRVPSDITRKRMSIAQTGRKHSKETKEKMRRTAIERERYKNFYPHLTEA